MHGLLTDELCVAIPDRASEDTIAVHKIRLGVSLGGLVVRGAGSQEGMLINLNLGHFIFKWDIPSINGTLCCLRNLVIR